MITRAQEYMLPDGLPPIDMLRSVLVEHMNNLGRLQNLGRYYNGRNSIVERVRSDGLPNNKLSHAYGRYIVTVATGYLIGNPVAYSTDEESETLDKIINIYKRQSIASVDIENARNASIYGRGIEYVFLDSDNNPKTAALKPTQAFVVYDDTYESNPMFGVYYIHKLKVDGTDDGYQIWVMGKTSIAQYSCPSLSAEEYSIATIQPHYFGDVPLVEYWNDESEKGDYEWVIPLIDAYDKLESDRVNDKEQFVDRLLLLTGCVLETDERGRPPWKQLREDKALCLPDAEAKATYLYSAMDENGNQILRDSIIEDIHKLSMIPDLTDKSFAANVSGVAMKYKLWGLEQVTSIKQQWFTEGLRTRLKLFANFYSLKGETTLDIKNVKIAFSRALPCNLQETAQYVAQAHSAAAMSIETRVRTLHADENWSDDDVQNEVKLIKEEAEPKPEVKEEQQADLSPTKSEDNRQQ